MIYLDYNATHPTRPEVVEAMREGRDEALYGSVSRYYEELLK